MPKSQWMRNAIFRHKWSVLRFKINIFTIYSCQFLSFTRWPLWCTHLSMYVAPLWRNRMDHTDAVWWTMNICPIRLGADPGTYSHLIRKRLITNRSGEACALKRVQEVLVDTSAAFASHPLVFQSNLFYRILLSSQEHFVCQTELFSFSKVGVFWLQG